MTARRILGTLAIVMLVSVITPVSIPGTAATDLTLGVTILESLRLEVDQQSLTIAPVSVPTVSSPSQSAAFTPACLVSTRIFNNTERPCYLSIMAKTPLDGTAGQLSVDHLEWSADRRTWTPLSATPARVLMGTPENDLLECPVYLRLGLHGEEHSGEYGTVLGLTLACP